MGLPTGLADFEGDWFLDRRIEDRRGPDARFEGRAVFTAAAGGLDYVETGVLRSGGQSFSATRRYFWRETDTGIAVHFEDGRFFHGFVAGATARAGHDCAPDRYDVAYDFTGWPAWCAVWDVRGPRKDYRMVSRFTRD